MKSPSFLPGTLLLLFGACLAHVLHASEPVFEPAESYFGSYSFEHAYQTNVRSILLKGLSDTPLALMVTMPGLSQESAIAIENKDDGFYVVRLAAAPRIWDNPKAEEVKVAVERTKIEADLAKLIQDVIFTAVSQTRYLPSDTVGLDGTNYYFTSYRKGDGLRAGKTWSPPDGTLAKALVAYLEAVGDYAKGGKTPEQKQRLLATGQDLLTRLEKNAK